VIGGRVDREGESSGTRKKAERIRKKVMGSRCGVENKRERERDVKGRRKKGMTRPTWRTHLRTRAHTYTCIYIYTRRLFCGGSRASNTVGGRASGCTERE